MSGFCAHDPGKAGIPFEAASLAGANIFSFVFSI
jgi:hypothetical protein